MGHQDIRYPTEEPYINSRKFRRKIEDLHTEENKPDGFEFLYLSAVFLEDDLFILQSKF